MTRRRGITLIEVLAAMFIMGIGAIAILTMFPLGAMNMANANRDDRCALAAFGADNYFRTYWKTEIVEKTPIAEPFYYALDNPNYPGPAGSFPAPGANEVSYPVFVDPMGWVARPSSAQLWLGDGGSTAIPRRNLGVVLSAGGLANPMAQRLCSLMDTIGSTDGVPNEERELRYNFLWVIQRPNNANKSTANLTVVTFDRRAHLFAPPGSEVVHQATFVPGQSSITLSSAPDIRPGAWIMDGTINPPGPPARPALRHANFYRVTAVNGNTLELQTPIKTPSDNNSNPYTGTVIILRGVGGVFPRTQLSAD